MLHQLTHSSHIKTVMTLLVVGLITTCGTVSSVSADLILGDPHIISGGITPTYTVEHVYLVANYVSETPLVYEQTAFYIGDAVPANNETTFEFTIPDTIDYTETRFYTVMAFRTPYDDVNLGFDSTAAAGLITNATNWASYFNESFQPTETAVADWLELGNTIELGGFLGDNSGSSLHKLGVGIDNYGDTVAYKLVDFCTATDNGDTWIREGRIPEPITLLLLTPGMLFVARCRRKN